MLAAFLDIKPKPATDGKAKKFGAAPGKTGKPVKALKASRTPAPLVGYDGGGTVHARFQSSPSEQAEACIAECDTLPEDAEAADPYEYLWQDANCAAEDDDTDSCATFADDATSDATDALSTSPADASFDTLDKAYFSRRKVRASEEPVYGGPELWFEDEDFID